MSKPKKSECPSSLKQIIAELNTLPDVNDPDALSEFERKVNDIESAFLKAREEQESGWKSHDKWTAKQEQMDRTLRIRYADEIYALTPGLKELLQINNPVHLVIQLNDLFRQKAALISLIRWYRSFMKSEITETDFFQLSGGAGGPSYRFTANSTLVLDGSWSAIETIINEKVNVGRIRICESPACNIIFWASRIGVSGRTTCSRACANFLMVRRFREKRYRKELEILEGQKRNLSDGHFQIERTEKRIKKLKGMLVLSDDQVS